MSVVVLNPGQMGSVVAAALVQAGRDTAWVSRDVVLHRASVRKRSD